MPYTNDNYNIIHYGSQQKAVLKNNTGIIPPTAKAVGFLIRGDREKSLLFALVGDLAMNVDLYGDAERMYDACREYGSEIPDLQAFAFKQINWIKNEMARLEAVELQK